MGIGRTEGGTAQWNERRADANVKASRGHNNNLRKRSLSQVVVVVTPESMFLKKLRRYDLRPVLGFAFSTHPISSMSYSRSPWRGQSPTDGRLPTTAQLATSNHGLNLRYCSSYGDSATHSSSVAYAFEPATTKHDDSAFEPNLPVRYRTAPSRAFSAGHSATAGSLYANSRGKCASPTPTLRAQHPPATQDVAAWRSARPQAHTPQSPPRYSPPRATATRKPIVAEPLVNIDGVFAPPVELAALRRSLDVAVLDSQRTRDESTASQQESMDELARNLWPTRAAALTARGLVVRIARAAARLCTSSERLEREAEMAHTVHVDTAQAAAEKAAALCTYLDQQRMTSEVVLLEEARAMEEVHEEDMERMRQAWRQEVGQLEDKRRIELEKAADAKAVVESQLMRLQQEHRVAVERVASLEAKNTVLQEEKAVMRAEWKANVEALNLDSTSYLANLREAHGSELERLEGLIDHTIKEKGELQEQLLKMQGENMRLRQGKSRAEFELARQVDEISRSKDAENERLQKQIDRLRSIHNAALAAGTYKGRQLLYMESLKANPSRRPTETESRKSANTAPNTASISWRGDMEVDELTRQQVRACQMSTPFTVAFWDPRLYAFLSLIIQYSHQTRSATTGRRCSDGLWCHRDRSCDCRPHDPHDQSASRHPRRYTTGPGGYVRVQMERPAVALTGQQFGLESSHWSTTSVAVRSVGLYANCSS